MIQIKAIGLRTLREKLALVAPEPLAVETSEVQLANSQPGHAAINPATESTTASSPLNIFKKLRGGLFLAVGYLLSPLSWWNDLFFNLPIAYLFGYLCSLVSPSFLLPGSIVGYWLSNVLGILMMQAGVLDVVQGAEPRNLKKELLMGMLSSTAYTVVIVALIKFGVLTTPDLFADASTLQWKLFFPDFLH